MDLGVDINHKPSKIPNLQLSTISDISEMLLQGPEYLKTSWFLVPYQLICTRLAQYTTNEGRNVIMAQRGRDHSCDTSLLRYVFTQMILNIFE